MAGVAGTTKAALSRALAATPMMTRVIRMLHLFVDMEPANRTIAIDGCTDTGIVSPLTQPSVNPQNDSEYRRKAQLRHGLGCGRRQFRRRVG
jgi:hypothetical protein